jgi:hypothetical protein
LRTILIGLAASIAVLIISVAAWLYAAPRSLFGDRDAYTVATLPSSLVSFNGTSLNFGEKGILTGGTVGELWRGGTDFAKPAATFMVDANNRLVMASGGRRFIFGYRAGSVRDQSGAYPAFAAEPGDRTSLTLKRAALSWPILFEFSLGPSPSWRRLAYYHLSWKKASGAELTMVWRFEEGYFSDGWRPSDAGDGKIGLLSIEIRPAR